MRGIKNLSLGVAIKQDKDVNQSNNEEGKVKDYLLNQNGENYDFIQESENEANDSEQDFSIQNNMTQNQKPQIQISSNSNNLNQSHNDS